MSLSPPETTHYDDLRIALSRWRKRTIGLLWIVYASFYLCRVNLAAAQKNLAVAEGITKHQLGSLLAGLKVFYAIGQFINGALADRFGPRVLITLGLGVSAGLNMVFAHLHDFRWMAVTWAINGYFQAFGWTSVVRTTANWFPARLRDAASGILGTSYILGSGLSWLLAGWLTQAYGWRYAFWVPAWVCAGVTILFLIVGRARPEDVGLGGIDSDAEPNETTPGEACPIWRSVLASPRLWSLACANAALIFGYHGLLDWTPHYLAESGGIAAAAAARRAFLMPLGGAIGCAGMTWIARRRSRQLGPAAVAVPLVILAGLTCAFPVLADGAPQLLPIALVLLGAFSSTPASLMACAMPANIAGSAGAGTAAGLVDAAGYVGSAGSSWVSGRIMESVSATRGQAAAWRVVWRVWPIGMIIAAAMVALSARPRKPEDTD